MLKSPSWARYQHCRQIVVTTVVQRHEGRPLRTVTRAPFQLLAHRSCRPAHSSALATASSMDIQCVPSLAEGHQNSSKALPPAAPNKQQQQQQLPAEVPFTQQQRALVSASGHTVLQDFNDSAFSLRMVPTGGHALLGLRSDRGPASLLDVEIGQITAARFLACARCKLWWMTPQVGDRAAAIPPETQFLLLELDPGRQYALVLPLICDDFRATLRASPDRRKPDTLCLRIESGDASVTATSWESSILLAVGSNPYELVETGVAAAAQLSGDALPRREKQLPAALELFGWCTWDAFYSTVSAAGLREGLKSLAAAGLRPRFLIIDDGWQLTDQPAFEGTDFPEVVALSEASVLAEAAQHMPQGSAAGTAMPTLGGVGVSPHHPHEVRTAEVRSTTSVSTDDAPASPHASTPSPTASTQLLPRADPALPALPTPLDAPVGPVTWVAQQVAGWMMGIGTAAVLLFYQLVVDPAPPGSLPVRLFASAAKGFLRQPLLAFYSTASDFTRRLVSVRANAKFADLTSGPDVDWRSKPARLGDVISHLKHEFGLKFVYCWHGLPAYWGGVMPGSELGAQCNAHVVFPQPTPGLLEIEPSMAWNPAVLGGVGVVDEPGPLFRDMHAYLSSSGVDGVKVDCQAGVGLVGSVLGGGAALSRRFHAALEDSVRRHFPGNHLINCMCHSTENLYRMTWSAVARASDDFFPRDAASSTPHISSCAYNSLFLSALVQPDWDMFHSRHPASRLHAIARAVSGGPVYISDRPGEHDVELLRRLVLPDGTILRAGLPGRPTRDSLFADPLCDAVTALKVWSANKVGGVVAAFNLQGSSWDRRRRRFHIHHKSPPPVTATVRPTDVDSFLVAEEERAAAGQAPGEYAVYINGSDHLCVLPADASVKVELPAGQADVVAVAPVQRLRGVAFAPVGLTSMYNASGAVLTTAATTATNLRLPPAAAPASTNLLPGAAAAPPASSAPVVLKGRTEHVVFSVQVRGCGAFVAYAAQAPVAVLLDGAPVACQQDGVRLVVDVPASTTLVCGLEFVFLPLE